MKYRKTFREAWDDVKNSNTDTPKGGTNESEVQGLKDQIQKLKLELENEKNKVVKPEPNPDTGEVPLRTGVAQAILDKKGPKPNLEKTKKEKVKLSSGQSKVEIDPDVDIGQISGGNKANTGNLH